MRTLRSQIPDPAMNNFALAIEKWVRDIFRSPLQLDAYAVADLPPADGWTNCVAICTDESGGRTLVTSDGTNWRRVKDGAIAS